MCRGVRGRGKGRKGKEGEERRKERNVGRGGKLTHEYYSHGRKE